MMRQAQPKSAATRADATTVRSSSWPIRRVGTMLSTGFASGATDMQVTNQMGHSKIETTKNIYGNPRVLHQPGEKPQVRRSRRRRNSVSRLRAATI